jgi:hypothetical protein
VGVWQHDQLLPMRRRGYTEECYFNFTFGPIRGDTGAVEGMFNDVLETTSTVIARRRERVLRELGDALAERREEHEFARAPEHRTRQVLIGVSALSVFRGSAALLDATIAPAARSGKKCARQILRAGGPLLRGQRSLLSRVCE